MNQLFTLLLFVIVLFTCFPEETPKPAFSWSNASEGTVQFTDQSSEADTYTWTFWDNSPTGTEKSPKLTSNGRVKVEPCATQGTFQQICTA